MSYMDHQAEAHHTCELVQIHRRPYAKLPSRRTSFHCPLRPDLQSLELRRHLHEAGPKGAQKVFMMVPAA